MDERNTKSRPDDSLASSNNPATLLERAPLAVRIEIFRFCSVADLGRCLAVSRGWKTDADVNPVWVDVYDRTQKADASSQPDDPDLRALIQRPFGEDAVGWRVAVLPEEYSGEDQDQYAEGHIIKYNPDRDAYLVAYDEQSTQHGGHREVWERDRRRGTAAVRLNPSLQGMSRFSFIEPPVQGWSHAAHERLKNVAANGVDQAPLLRFRSWKEELEHNARNAPSRLLCHLRDHRDEVLYVVFSPSGRRLASCSRDLRTMIFRMHLVEGQPHFEREAVFQHQTSPCRAIWWPAAPYNLVAVSTEEGWQERSRVEIWEILSDHPSETSQHELPEGSPFNARCIYYVPSAPFDVYAAILTWPMRDDDSVLDAVDLKELSFISGSGVFREANHYEQWLNIWPGPTHRSFQLGDSPLAQLRLEGSMNFYHCLEVGPGNQKHRIVAMSGSTPHLCDEIGIIDLRKLRQRHDGAVQDMPAYDAPVEVKRMGSRAVLSVRWNRSGDLLILNTRPYAQSWNSGFGRNQLSFDELISIPAPDLSTSMELFLLDAVTLETLSVFDGHFAFTTKECPFLIFTDEWAQSDFLASGGEDQRVYIWHRRHNRLLRRLCGHTKSVNAVSWNGNGLLASASDDHSVIIWAPGKTAAWWCDQTASFGPNSASMSVVSADR